MRTANEIHKTSKTHAVRLTREEMALAEIEFLKEWIERCAQVAERFDGGGAANAPFIAAAIRKLKAK